MSDELQLTTLGKLEMTQGGVPVTGFVYKKSLALLCYLAVTGRPHTREALADLLWGEATEANARAGLRKSLTDLRKLLGSHVIISRHQVAFDRERPYWLDVEVFERGGGIAVARDRDGALTDEDAVTLAAAVDLYRGDFLAGFYVHRAPGFENWCTLKRERLRLLALRMLHALADHYTARGAYTQAIAYVGRVLALEPAQEEAHRQMMSLLALTDQQGAALRQYNTCRRVLADELGVEPEEETTALYERIRAEGELDVHAPFPPHNLPTPLTPLIGRDYELAEIVTCLHDPACRLLTLVGPGGSGKTHLALEVANLLVLARSSANAFRDGVYWISLAPLRSTEAIVPAIAQSLGFLFHAEGKPRRQLLDYVRPKNLLLVMDNAEHLLASSQSSFSKDEKKGVEGLMSNVLEAAPGVKILVTSRARLNLRYEHLFPVTGMDVPPPPKSDGYGEQAQEPFLISSKGTQEGLTEYSAVRLFLQSARRVQPGLELTDDDLADVARICRRVAGMPLGILLAASWIRLLSSAEIAAHLSDEVTGDVPPTDRALDLLETDWHDIPTRQRSMRAVFDHSWNLLTEREQEILAALSVFRGGFTYEASRQVSGTSLRELMALMDQSLLQRVFSGRYEVHELLRQYAEERLESKDWRVEIKSRGIDTQSPIFDLQSLVRDRHSAYYANRLQKWAADLKSDQQIAALEEMGIEIANARAAWDWMVGQANAARIDLALEGLCLFYEWRGRYQEGESACQAAAQALSRPSLAQSWENGAVERLLARVLAWQGVFSETECARQLLRESLALLEDAELVDQDTRLEKAFVLLKMGSIAEGDVPSLEQSLALYRRLDDRWGTAQALEALGWSAWNSGIYDKAERLYKESLTIYQALGDQRGIAGSLQWLGVTSLYQGQLEGERLVREGITIYQEIGERTLIAGGLAIAGAGLLSLGEFAEAHEFLKKGVALYDDLGISSPFANMLLGGAKVHLGQYEQGHAWGQTVLDAARELDRSAVGFPLIVLGWVALVREAYTQAQRLFQEGADACQDAEQQELLSWVLAFLGYADQGLGQFAQAKRHLLQALQMAVDIQSFVGLVFTLSGIALLLADLDQQERAVELYALASRYPVVANSRWFADVVGRPIAAVAAALPPDVVAAAEERGRARDLDVTMAELLVELGKGLFQAP